MQATRLRLSQRRDIWRLRQYLRLRPARHQAAPDPRRRAGGAQSSRSATTWSGIEAAIITRTRACTRPPGTLSASAIRSSIAAIARRASRRPSGPVECGRKPSKHPAGTSEFPADFTEVRQFNLLFQTIVGPVQEEARRSSAPGDGAGHVRQLRERHECTRHKLPFGIAQNGKSFRNEITPGNFIFRMREFEQMEMEYFVAPDEAKRWFEHWLSERMAWYQKLGIRPDHLRLRAHTTEELSHYSSATSDVEYLFPIGWSELEGIANRGDFDLRQHAAYSGQKLEYVDTEPARATCPRDRAGRRRRPRRVGVPCRCL